MNKLLLGCFRSPVKVFPARSQKTTDRLSPDTELLGRKSTCKSKPNNFATAVEQVRESACCSCYFIVVSRCIYFQSFYQVCTGVYSYRIIIAAGCSVAHSDILFHDFLFIHE